jgi:uncharacterized membrane protein YgaE (UPF0421/DUF939 family)
MLAAFNKSPAATLEKRLEEMIQLLHRDWKNNDDLLKQESERKLRAIDLLLKIERERRTIIGYTAPSKRVMEVITEDQLDRAIRQYIEEAEALERDAAEIEARRKVAS